MSPRPLLSVHAYGKVRRAMKDADGIFSYVNDLVRRLQLVELAPFDHICLHIGFGNSDTFEPHIEGVTDGELQAYVAIHQGRVNGKTSAAVSFQLIAATLIALLKAALDFRLPKRALLSELVRTSTWWQCSLFLADARFPRWLGRQAVELLRRDALTVGACHPRVQDVRETAFLWDETDELSPFGNDDGADTVSDYRLWRLDRPRESAVAFLDGLMKEWGIPNDHWEVTAESEAYRLWTENDAACLQRDNAVVALAFAQLILEGSAERLITERALSALVRESCEFALGAWGHSSPERVSRLSTLRRILTEQRDRVLEFAEDPDGR